MKNLVLLAFSVLIFSCSAKDDVPKGILKRDKMQEVLWDIIRADVYTTAFIKHDSAGTEVIENLKLQAKIFKLHQVTKEDFYKSYTYYSNNKDKISLVLDSMIARHQNKSRIKPVFTDRE